MGLSDIEFDDICDRRLGFSDEDVFSDQDCDYELFSDDDLAVEYSSFEDPELDLLTESLERTELLSANAKRTEVALEEDIWSRLPEEVLNKILTWLPIAAMFRLRCVCTRWKALFSSPGWLQQYSQVQNRPSCTLLCLLGGREANFFCHMEQKWFTVPENPVSCLELDWELADTDAGLVCYQCYWSGALWFCVCNPLTQSSKVLPPNYPHWGVLEAQPSNCELVKLLVDRQTKNFRVVALVHSSSPPTTVVYDSTTSLWTVCKSYPPQDFRSGTFFVWKNNIYSQCFQSNLLLAFTSESGTWSEVKFDLPCPGDLARKHYVVNNDRLLLIRLDSSVEEPILVWKLLEDAPNCCSPSASKSKWLKLALSIPTNLRRLLSDVDSCFPQRDCICFSTSFTNKWITFTFGTKSWRVMPSRGMNRVAYSWFEWDPRLDIDVKSDPLYESN